MSVRVEHRDRDRDRERFSRHSSRASVDLAFPSSSSRDHSFRSVHSGRVPRVASDDLMVPVRTLRSASCRATSGAPHRLRRHHSSAAECDRTRRPRRHTLELPNSRGPSVRSRSPEPPPPQPVEPEIPPEDASKEARRRRVVAAVAASFFMLALASILVVVVTLTHSSVMRAHNQTANTAGERATDARRPSGGNRQSHPVVGGIALTPRYSPRPRLDNIRPAAAPPEEPPEPLETPYGQSNNASVPVSTTLAGPA
ncbi:uncharacterized protein LOC111001001 isoform X1 [Pieris rapae]|uniref:uncharacterized protein LOC111001001 isoform X1 n=1 Tax=Pieris rapae TaxID=64459 RepID=UPI001E27E543|nr:uncharacterized protein LOC111001001 isoform X1 [Pieris rapae]